MSRHAYSSGSSDLGGAAGAGAVMLGVVVIVLAIYLLVKITNLLFRVFTKHPKNKALWIGVGCIAATTTICLIAQDSTISPTMGVLAGISFLGLLATARIVELYYDDKFQQEGTLMNNVLRKSWWQGNNQLKKTA